MQSRIETNYMIRIEVHPTLGLLLSGHNSNKERELRNNPNSRSHICPRNNSSAPKSTKGAGLTVRYRRLSFLRQLPLSHSAFLADSIRRRRRRLDQLPILWASIQQSPVKTRCQFPVTLTGFWGYHHPIKIMLYSKKLFRISSKGLRIF